MVCKNCGAELVENAKFCGKCGTEVKNEEKEVVKCRECGMFFDQSLGICPFCGAELVSVLEELDDKTTETTITTKNIVKLKENIMVTPVFRDQPSAEYGVKKQDLVENEKDFVNIKKLLNKESIKRKLKFLKKSTRIAVSCISIILVISIVLSLFYNSDRNKNIAMYIKNGEMYFTSLYKISPLEVTEKIFEYTSLDEDDVNDARYTMGIYSQLSKDGKILFYVERISNNSDGLTLYCRNVKKSESEPIKLDSNIFTYSISESGKKVTYIKGENNSLYQHNLKDKKKIATGVQDFYVSDDGKNVCYLDDENDIYFYGTKADCGIAQNVSKICHVNEKFDTIYYLKNEILYKYVIGSGKEKIAENVYSVINVYQTGVIYYLTYEQVESSYDNYFEDNMKDVDATMQKPSYPSYNDYNSYDEYENAISKYYYDLDEFYNKENRDKIREEIKNQKYTTNMYSLCYYNGEKSKVLDNDVVNKYLNSFEYDTNYRRIVYEVLDKVNAEKVKISQVDSIEELDESIEFNLNLITKKFIAIDEVVTEIEENDARDFYFDSEGERIYYLANVSGKKESGVLYNRDISNGKIGMAHSVDHDVSIYGLRLTPDNKIVYFKSAEDTHGDLYIDCELIDYEVEMFSVSFIKDSKKVVYLTDWDEKNEFGTLKICRIGKTKKIADDVHDFQTTPNGTVVYLCDYSKNSCTGKLYAYKNGKSKKIDHKVNCIIPMFEMKYRNFVYLQ